MYPSLLEFQKQLDKVLWFSSVGKDSDYAHRIYDWNEWKGPESIEARLIGFWQQELYDNLVSNDENEMRLKPLFDETLARTENRCAKAIVLKTDTDPWDGPSAAKWQAAWTASLCAVHVAINRPWPKDLQTMWDWFQKGRWPCEHVLDSRERQNQHKELYACGTNAIGYAKIFENNPNIFKIY